MTVSDMVGNNVRYVRVVGFQTPMKSKTFNGTLLRTLVENFDDNLQCLLFILAWLKRMLRKY